MPDRPHTALCTCGHPIYSHHRTDKGNRTYCTVWENHDSKPTHNRCECNKATPKETR